MVPLAVANLAVKECVPETAFHVAEKTLLDCAASDTSCEESCALSAKKVSVPLIAAPVPL
ncbi:hypothetical protein D3C83_173280 [compost metagenome]